ncbi:MAG: putative addiction module antidote protein [Azonexus sp.]|nr:addiction module antidote protein [Azonexus sp.]MCK6412676.1 putative addiction module antidote protein [Azonexus sp.]
MLKTRKFDVAELLDDESEVQAFLDEAATSGDAAAFVHALGIAARAKGMTEVARAAGVTRASLYKSLADGGNPQFETIFKVCRALGVRLAAIPEMAAH